MNKVSVLSNCSSDGEISNTCVIFVRKLNG